MSETTSLEIKDLKFSLPYITGRTSLSNMGGLRALTSTMLQRKRYDTEIIKGVNLSLKSGDRVGLIGRNGAGKSTLLRLMAGAYSPTGGSIITNGKITSLISVGAGFNRMATGLENITLRGLNLDMTMDEIHEATEEIIKFSELENSIHKPLYTYSDGMRARLAFAIAVETNPDILLLDEWLGAGDQEFQDKAADRMVEFVQQSGITVLATHNKRIINQVCNRIIEVSDGRIIQDEPIENASDLPFNLKDQIRFYEKNIETLQGEKALLRDKLNESRQLTKNLSSTLEGARERKYVLKKEVKEKKAIEAELQRIRTAKDTLQKEVKEKKAIEAELQRIRTAKDTLQKEVKEKKAIEVELQRIRTAKDTLQKEVKEKKAIEVELQRIRTAKDTLQKEVKEKKAIEAELQRIRSEKNTLKKKLRKTKTVDAEFQRVKAEKDAFKKELKEKSAIEVELQRLKGEKEKLKKELKEKSVIEAQLWQVKAKKDELRIETRVLRKELKNMEAHKESLKKKLAQRE